MYRQSDRDLPRTNYPKGISMSANLTSHEIPGCLLVKLFALHATIFRDIFRKRRKILKAEKVEDGDPPAPPEPEVNYLCRDRHVVDWI